MRTNVRTSSAKEVKRMMKLSEFARIYNVSERHARRLFAENEADISGHYDRRGREGTFLDDVAVDVLRSRLQKQFSVSVETASERERQLEGTITKLSMKYATAMEELVKNAGAVALLEAAKENVAQLEARASEAEIRANEREREIRDLEITLEGIRKEAQYRADEAQQLDEERARAEVRANDLQAQLDRLAAAGYRERRKILKDLKKQRRNKE